MSIVGFAWSVPYSWIRARCVVRTFRHESDSFHMCPDINSKSQDTDTPPSFHPIQVLFKKSRLTGRILRVFQDGMLQHKRLWRRESLRLSLVERRRYSKEYVDSKMVTPNQRRKLGRLSSFSEGQSIISRNMTSNACLVVHALCTQESPA